MMMIDCNHVIFTFSLVLYVCFFLKKKALGHFEESHRTFLVGAVEAQFHIYTVHVCFPFSLRCICSACTKR
ncbi:hypothetical protein BGX38DRAFT_1237720 [Terfezia claveryi]|nr:hypothetical protein BGX38DRAFT_1237720 [Terfezia claveryi]